MKIIVWFRQDLRIEDNPALFHACQEGEVLPVFILDEASSWGLGGASKWWLHHSLKALQEELQHLGLDLFFFKGRSKEVLEKLISDNDVDAIYWNRRYEPHLISQDKKIKSFFSDKEIDVQTFKANLLFEPWEIKNKQGKPYEVFSPFWREAMRKPKPDEPVSKPRKSELVSAKKKSMTLDELELLPQIPWDEGFYETWNPGSSHGKKILKKFLSSNITTYSKQRDVPGKQGTSRLSPYLHFGEISPRQIWHATTKKFNLNKDKDAEHFIREVGWREFGYHLLFHFPHTVEEPLREKFKNFPWRRSKKDLKRWQKGETGFPIVDAGMRELWHTGWMHNRVRMIVASFLVKDLRIDWRDGAQWFWDTLVDADLASNTLGWQWAGGCGADAAPYFRVFNPMTQGEKFDAKGAYVQKWIPELSSLDQKWIHRPFEAPKSELEKAGVILGKDYPKPICDHSEARKEALMAFEAVKKASE